MKPTVPGVLKLIQEYYRKPENCVGGSLHIVLDDGNIENEHVQFCIDFARNRLDQDGVELGETILKMSKTQRQKLYNSHSKFYASA